MRCLQSHSTLRPTILLSTIAVASRLLAVVDTRWTSLPLILIVKLHVLIVSRLGYLYDIMILSEKEAVGGKVKSQVAIGKKSNRKEVVMKEAKL